MELKLDVVLSSRIKRKKPWPRFCWLGQEKECVFLFDDKRISEINMVSGRTKKKTPKLHPLLNNVVTMAPSRNGMWFCGLLTSGELFLWNKDNDSLRTATAVPEVIQIITAIQGNSTRISVHVSDDGTRVLLVTTLGQTFLWECTDMEDLTLVCDGSVKGHWAQLQMPQDTSLPTLKEKEASQSSIFVRSQTMGDVCLSAFVFTSGKKLIITCLKIEWLDQHVHFGSLGYSIQWATKTYLMSRLTPPCQAVKSRGALVVDFSPDGQLLAIALNQRQPKATQVLFVSTQNFVSVSSGLGRCGCKTEQVPPKYTRSFWVGSLSWSHDSLFLACVLKRGALLVLSRLGGLLSLTSSGCNIDFGAAHFLPLHPLVTYRPPTGSAEAYLSSSSVSARDAMRQRYSVTWHPRLLYCIVSDGYMATVLRVLNRPSPAMLVKALLDNTGKDLQKACQLLDTSQMYVRTCLESYLDLDGKSLTASGPHRADSIISAATQDSTLPFFLQDQGTFSGTKELFERVQSFFEDDSDIDGPPPGSQLADSGHLEFASMFDTLHALDTDTDLNQDHEEDFEITISHLRRDLSKIQNGILTTWALCMSMGSAVENRAHLLKCTTFRVAQLAALLHLMPNDAAHSGKSDHSGSACILELLKALFSFLPWDNTHLDGPPGLGLAVELSQRLVHLLLAPPPECHPASCVKRLSDAVLILQLASEALDCAYSLQQRTIWSSVEKDPPLSSSDVYHVPQLQDYREHRCDPFHQVLPLPQRPSNRLFGVWQWVYKISQDYKEGLRGFKDDDGSEEGGEEQLSIIMSKIQTALQATGEKIEEGPALLNHTGEELFLCGLYQHSTETWRTQIWEESKKSCRRSAFQETRLCLALLYNLLSQYHLKEAVELGEHMAHLALHNAAHHHKHATCTTADPLLPTNLHIDAVVAVIHTLGRFMAAYFTNQPLNILPAHHVAVLPPLHLPHASNLGRLVPLCQETTARAVRQQYMSEKWTVDYAVDLLLLGGLLPETAWLAHKLGDWKTSASVSLAYVYYCAGHLDMTRISRPELHLPKALLPNSIFQTELQCLVDNDSGEHSDVNDTRFTDPVEAQDLDALQGSAQEILKASVIAGVDVLTSQLTFLLESAKDLCSSMSALVHSGLYLPSPPLYCPQPSPNTQDPVGTPGQLAEVATRHKVSGVLQRILLLLRSARCCHPAAQWYVGNLRRARHLLHKIKTKYAYPSFPKEEKALPEGLMKFVSRGGFFRRSHSKALHPDCSQTIICFRELCGLCWMLHVRDQLSVACRRFQAARMQQDPDNSQVHSSCINALLWATRYLPFSHFLNTEEILQDLLLSLLAELPPMALVADTLVLAFPEKEESVRVSLREKYNSLLEGLKQCSVFEEGKEPDSKPMKALIQEKLRQRRKHRGRLLRHLAPLELWLWEKDEDDKRQAATLRPCSAGASVSASTVTDCVDGERSEATSEAVLPDPDISSIAREVKVKATGTAVATKKAIKDVAPHSLPVIGTWEFELEDDEYLTFLELFLSYMLEKENSDGGELPLLKSFHAALRDKELHSLTFDVLTTIHRRQRNGQELPVFRAGCCHRPAKGGTTPESRTSAALNGACEAKSNLFASPLSELRTERQTGLFSLRSQKRASGSDGNQNALAFASSTTAEAIVELQQVPDPKLEARFPVLGRLLQWMLRWADKRVLLGHTGKKKKPKGEGMCEDGIVIRVKTSAPALLTSLSLLERRFIHLLRPGCPEARWAITLLLQSEADTRLERHSTVETSRHRSVHTPVAGLDHIVDQGELSICSHVDEPEELKSDRMSLPDEPEELNLTTPIPSSRSQRPCFDDLDVTPEKEGKSSDDRMEHSSSLSNGIMSENLFSPQAVNINLSLWLLHTAVCIYKQMSVLSSFQSFKLEDLIETFSSTSAQVENHPVIRAPDGPIPQIPPSVQPQASLHTELPHPRANLYPNTPLDHAGSRPHTSTPGAPALDHFGPDQPPSLQAPPMRQRLGEDLYRLVQNINYMSLMDVLGASFSNLQLAQQNSYLAQSNMTPHYVPSPYMTNVPPQHYPQPAQNPSVSQSQIHVPDQHSSNPPYAYQTPTHSTHGPHHVSNVAYASHDAGGTYQEFTPLSVQAESTDIHFQESIRLIPSSEGLLITSSTNTIAPSIGSIYAEPSSQKSGLKLLQLQGGRKRDKKRTKGPSLTPKRLIRFSHSTQTESSPARSFRPQNPTSDVTHGLRLLHLQSGAQGYINLPKTHSTPLPKHFFLPAVPLGETPKLQLLHIDRKPTRMSTPAPRSSQKARLISLEELAGLVAGRRNSEEARLQLLRVNDSAEAQRGATPSSSSSKRQKRRERALRTNLPNEQPIITAQEPNVDQEEITTPRNASIQTTIPSPSGSSHSVSNGRTLLDRTRTTSAELHAFASTCKRPPECLDAFTNTEPKYSPMLVDKAVSVQASLLAATSTGKSKEHTPEKLYRESPQDANVIPPLQERKNLDQRGRNFLSVVDIEEGTQHRDLPPASSRMKEASSIPPVLTPAQLHMLATSGINTAHHADQKIPTTVTETDTRKSTTEPTREPERVYSENVNDGEVYKAIWTRRRERPHNLEPESLYSEERLDSELMIAMKTQRRERPSHSEDSTDSELSTSIRTPRLDEPRNHPSEIAAVWFSSHLSKLDSQLAALQNIADCLEKDLPQSRIPKKPYKPQQVSPVSPPNVKPAVRKTVRLFLPAEEPKTQPKHTPISVRKPIIETRAAPPPPPPAPKHDIRQVEEDEKRDAFPNVDHNPDRKLLAAHPTSSSQLCHGHQSLPKQLSTVTLERFDETPDESLDHTGLSDTAEILEGLVREGYISQNDLDASLSNALDSGKEQQEPSLQISPVRAARDEDDERRELKIWMRRKQRERHSVYQKQKASLREREIKPFTRTPKSTSQVTSGQKTQEKQKSLLLKRFNQRLRDARLLADQLRTSPLPGSHSLVNDATAVRSSSALATAVNHRKEKSLKYPSGQTHTQRRPCTAEATGGPSEDRGRPELQQRPGTSLSKERPVTSASDLEDQHMTQQGVNLLLSELIDEEDSGTRAGVPGMEWLDKLSESGGSLSEVDWEAIERMAAMAQT
ncbi:ciliogenesis and planar polarity effector 1 isoform X1 [Hippocampus zosterae]|uniref:ciliogenesis and planar polarity effector 1 isoform X1 n=1 Tax=Hippocampus zosterae TaxID=109293 RepID=UPI00223D43DE|nr:ciliogenesis and planar polarity effector 1 isoform X1 [Hippocampus zosterae]